MVQVEALLLDGNTLISPIDPNSVKIRPIPKYLSRKQFRKLKSSTVATKVAFSSFPSYFEVSGNHFSINVHQSILDDSFNGIKPIIITTSLKKSNNGYIVEINTNSNKITINSLHELDRIKSRSYPQTSANLNKGQTLNITYKLVGSVILRQEFWN